MNDLFVNTFIALNWIAGTGQLHKQYIMRTLTVAFFTVTKFGKRLVLDGRVVNDQFERVQ